MKKSILNTANKVIKLALVVLVVFFIENGSSKIVEQSISNENLNRTLDLSNMALKVEEENMNNLYYVLDIYTGSLSGYGADCYGCGGYLPGLGINIKETNQITYQDKEYGNVRIVAASANLPFGSIVKFNLPKLQKEPILAIVADRGGAITGTRLDLLCESEDYARQYVGRGTITYEVLRLGWNR